MAVVPVCPSWNFDYLIILLANKIQHLFAFFLFSLHMYNPVIVCISEQILKFQFIIPFELY